MVREGTLNVPVIGVASAPWTTEQLRARARESLEHHGGVDRAAFDKLASLLRYVGGDYRDPRTFAAMRRELGPAQRPLHYLAIPASVFGEVIRSLAVSGCATQARVALEKPFGRDLASARALNETLHRVFAESSIFRIDHYLGKEPLRNLLYFRFNNLVLESITNRHYVDHVQITMAESYGVQGRGAFYDETGAVRDVIQNHMLQLVAMLAMDPPSRDDVEAIRDEKARLLGSIKTLDPSHVVRGQFRGYQDEPGVAKGSTVETFAAVELRIDNWRWADVPFFIRAGKCLPDSAVEVRVQLKQPPRHSLRELAVSGEYYRFRIGPDVTAMAVGMRFKKPGDAMVGRDIELVASEGQATYLPTYARLLGDAMRGDAGLFTRQDAVEAQWRIVDPIVGLSSPPAIYEPGSWGPAEADRLVAGVSGGWHAPVAPPPSSSGA
jgi:glucose-6-phosphate 1-dehydrogenase